MVDVFDITETLNRVCDHRSAESARRGNTPTLARDVAGLRLRHKSGYLLGDTERRKVGEHIIECTINHKVEASKVPLSTLSRISMRDLRMERATKGGYLTLRTLEAAFFSENIATIVEDHLGNAVLYCLYNFTEDKNPNLSEILPIGAVFILKEPYMRMSYGNECILRCDCPSDMIIVYKGHNLFPLVEGIVWKNAIDPTVVDPMFSDPEPNTALEWKERGNQMFKEKKLEYATRCYLLALKALPGTDNVGNLEQVLFLNLSETYRQRGFFENGIDYGIKVLKIDDKNEKALYRVGICCYNLRKYGEAKRYFTKCNSLYPANVDIKKELKKVAERLVETEGKYDMPKMFKIQYSTSLEKIDIADYTGPIRIAKIHGKGRGYVATEDLEPGTLLMVSQALVFDWVSDNFQKIAINYDNSYNSGSGSCNIAQLGQAVAKNFKTYASPIYDLYDGGVSEDLGPAKLFCNPETGEEPIVDMRRIRNILLHNSFDNCYINRKAYQNFSYEGGLIGGGLFISPCYFNHSCISNASYHIFNGVMFIRSIHYIKANEEVNLPYFSWDTDFQTREDICRRRKFRCECRLCIVERNTTQAVRTRRKAIYDRADVHLRNTLYRSGNRDVIRTFHRIITDLVDTYSGNGYISLDTRLLQLYNALAEEYAFCSPPRFDKMIEIQYDFLKVFGFDPKRMLKYMDRGVTLISPNSLVTVEAVDVVVSLIYSHHIGRRNVIKHKWIRILRTLEHIYTGGDIDALKQRYSLNPELMESFQSASSIGEELKSIRMTNK